MASHSTGCNRWRPIAGALGLVIAAMVSIPIVAQAYPPPGGTAVVQAVNCNAPAPGKECKVTFTEVDASGQPVSGDNVTWSVAGGTGSVFPSSSVTDAKGVATTTFTAGPACGKATVSGTSPRSAGQTDIAVTCPATPSPAVVPAAPGVVIQQQSLNVPWPVIGGIVAGAALAVAGAITLLRVRRRGI